MKKILLLCLIAISAVAQQKVEVNEKMFVGFMREDGVFVIYDAKGIVTVQDGFALKLETYDLKLSKFLAITDFQNTLDEARAKLGLSSITQPVSKPDDNSRKNTSWGLGQVGSRYGSRYETELYELKYGVSIFRFTGQDVNYPEYDSGLQSTDELSIIDFPTHSIINYAGTDFVSMIEMKLIDELGNEVWYLYDTRGGYHPCINGVDCNSKLRGNNHTDDANRWVKNGKYKLWVKNHSIDKRAVQRIDFGTTIDGDYFQSFLEPGKEQTFDIDISRLKKGYYKINCNVWTR